MNPPSYPWKNHGDVPSEPSPVPAPPIISSAPPQQSFIRQLFLAPISSAIALAVVVLAAGSVMAMTVPASVEIAMANPDSFAYHHIKINDASQVLGDSTTTPAVIDDAALEAAYPAAGLSAKPVKFDATLGRWDYKFSYTASNLTEPATITIGTYVVQSGITASGSVETGAILKPNMVYHAAISTTDSSGNSQTLFILNLRTPNGKGKTTPVPCPEASGQSASTNCLPYPCLISPRLEESASSSSGTTKPAICQKGSGDNTNCTQLFCLPLMPPGDHASGTPPQYHSSGTPPMYHASGTPGNLPPPPPPPSNPNHQ